MKVQDLIAEAQGLPVEERAMLAQTILKDLRARKTTTVPSLRDHPAFGRWLKKKVDGLTYQDDLRHEWPL